METTADDPKPDVVAENADSETSELMKCFIDISTVYWSRTMSGYPLDHTLKECHKTAMDHGFIDLVHIIEEMA